MLTPRTLKGFRDFLPETMLPREQLIESATAVFRSYGFSPIDTPCLEYLEILQGKGGDETDKQLYKFEDHGKRQVGMRFDLTVPLARFAAQHFAELPMPFKRYHFGKVWRGENTQNGRYREFMQCDFDIIGTRSVVSDIEIALVINDLLENTFGKAAGGAGGNSFKIHVNNRKVLSGLLDKYGIADKSVPVLRALDKLAKIGKDGVYKELTGQYNEQESVFPALSETQANAVLQLADIHGSNDEILAALATVLDGNALGEEGVEQLAGLCNVFSTLQTDRLMIDVSIARGLDYYTGTIYETFLDALPAIGSVCSGGRYDNLAGLFTKQELPGIGASLGLDRLLAAMEELGLLPKAATPIDVFIPLFVESRLGDYLKIADGLRKRGIGVEVFHEAKKLGQQLKYADRRGYKFAVIIGEDEFAKGIAKVKNLQTQTSTEYPLNNITLSAT